MELQTIAVMVAIASPVVMTAVAWGTYTARLHALEKRVDRIEDARARERVGGLREA